MPELIESIARWVVECLLELVMFLEDLWERFSVWWYQDKQVSLEKVIVKEQEHKPMSELEELKAWMASNDINAIDGQGMTALANLVLEGAGDMVAALLEAGADQNILYHEARQTVSMLAFNRGLYQIVSLLINDKADLDIQNYFGETLLTMAANEGHVDTVRQLINAKVNLFIQDENGTALSNAAYHGHIEVVRLLVRAILEYGAGLDTKNFDGATALMVAASQGHLDIVNLLIDHGASIDVQSNSGSTALIEAAHMGYGNVVSRLIDAGANRELTDNFGTALENAIARGHQECQLLLKQAALSIAHLNEVSVFDKRGVSEGLEGAMRIANKKIEITAM